ncbi:MAG: hypothetical protein EXS36_08695 [Pedosphaera sp.]|nr:hypothetical protein [Pedosphaera sp.]
MLRVAGWLLLCGYWLQGVGHGMVFLDPKQGRDHNTQPPPPELGAGIWDASGYHGGYLGKPNSQWLAVPVGPHTFLATSHVGLYDEIYMDGKAYWVTYRRVVERDLTVYRVRRGIPRWFQVLPQILAVTNTVPISTNITAMATNIAWITYAGTKPTELTNRVLTISKGGVGRLHWALNQGIGLYNMGDGIVGAVHCTTPVTGEDARAEGGDSSGLVFVEHKGRWILFGVVQRLEFLAAAVGSQALTDQHRSWIDFATADWEPAGPPKPVPSWKRKVNKKAE